MKDVIIIATLQLIFIGAKVAPLEEGFDPQKLIFKTKSIIWLTILLSICVVTLPHRFIVLCRRDCPYLTNRVNFTFFLASETANYVVANTLNKLTGVLKGNALTINIILMVIMNVSGMHTGFVRSITIVHQGDYYVFFLSLYLIFNGITGESSWIAYVDNQINLLMKSSSWFSCFVLCCTCDKGLIVWEDKVDSIGIYVLVYFHLCVGNYLITKSENNPSEFTNLNELKTSERTCETYLEKYDQTPTSSIDNTADV